MCLRWRVSLTVLQDGETESQRRGGASQVQGEAVHESEQGNSVSCGVGRAPSFFHRHHLLKQSLIFKLRSPEVFLPGLLSSRQNFLCMQLVVDRKAAPPPSLGWMHTDSCTILALTSVKFGSSPNDCSSLCSREQAHTKGIWPEPFLKW